MCDEFYVAVARSTRIATFVSGDELRLSGLDLGVLIASSQWFGTSARRVGNVDWPVRERFVPTPVLTSCPHCGEKYRLKESAAGRKIRCRDCRKSFWISTPADEPGDEAEELVFDIPPDDVFDIPPEDQAAVALPPQPVRKRMKKASPAPAEKENSKRRDAATWPARFNAMPPLAIGGVIVAGVVALLLVPALSPGGSGIKPPEGYETYKDEVGQQFRIEYPQGWAVDFGGRGTSNPWVRFEKESALIRVKTSMGASAIGDIAKSATQGADLPDELKPVAQVHELMKEQFAADFSGYEEQPPRTVDAKMGEARLSEFTASGSWGSKIKGTRLSCLGRDYQFTVICSCPEADWPVCKPIFERASLSLSR